MTNITAHQSRKNVQDQIQTKPLKPLIKHTSTRLFAVYNYRGLVVKIMSNSHGYYATVHEYRGIYPDPTPLIETADQIESVDAAYQAGKELIDQLLEK